MDTLNNFISNFFPENFKYSSNRIDDDSVTLFFTTKTKTATCPICGTKTSDYATYYERTVQDLPILDKQTNIKIKFKKMRCSSSSCKVKYFNESLSDYVEDNKRFSNRLIDLLIKVSLTESAEAGSRLLKEKKIKVSPDKLLQLSKEYNYMVEKDNVISIGVDDFSLKKNIDMVLFL